MGRRRNRGPAQQGTLPQPSEDGLAKNSARGALLAVLAARPALPASLALHTPTALALEAGVSSDVVRELMRDCVVPDEVLMDRGRGVVVATEAGRGKILAALAARISPAAPVAAEALRLRVRRLNGAKRAICVRVGDEDAEEVVCLVQSTANLMPDMELEGAEESAQRGLFSYYGRLPRKKGRW